MLQFIADNFFILFAIVVFALILLIGCTAEGFNLK